MNRIVIELVISFLLCGRSASLSVSENFLRRRVEELELRLFWKTYSKDMITHTMMHLNQNELDPPCRCLSCRISGRMSADIDGPPMTHHHQYGDCSFKTYFEDKLAYYGLTCGREFDDESSHDFHFIIEGRGDWIFWKFGRKLIYAKCVNDPEIKKLKRMLDEMNNCSVSVQNPDGGSQESYNESIYIKDDLNDPTDKLQNSLNRIVDGLEHKSLDEIRTTVHLNVDSAQRAMQQVAKYLEDCRYDKMSSETTKASLEAQITHLTEERDKLSLQLHEVVCDRLPALICPISRDIFHDPVLLVGSGHTYERADLVRWLREHDTDPVTNSALVSKEYVTNYLVKSLLDCEAAQKRA